MGPAKFRLKNFWGPPIPGGLLLALPRLKIEKISVAFIFDQGGGGPNPRFSVSGPEIYRAIGVAGGSAGGGPQ